jgi:hypothetical protein
MSLKTRKQQKNISEIKTVPFEKSSQINKPQLTQPRQARKRQRSHIIDMKNKKRFQGN